jgi:hypothetical protein
MVALVGIALITIPAYLSGNAAQKLICTGGPEEPCQDTNISKPNIEEHENAAMWSFAFMELVGAFAWLGLWRHRRSTRFPRWSTAAVLIFSVATLAAVTRTANIGGEIRHSEIRGEQLSAPPTEKPLVREIGSYLAGGVRWGWAACETIHFIGLSVLFGVVLLIDLRMLGLMKSLSFQALHRLLPWAMLGFAANTLTGMLFYAAGFNQMYTNSAPFFWKIVLILGAGANAVYFTVFEDAWRVKAGMDASPFAKTMGAAGIALWVGVIYCGHMLPFIGDAF